MNGTTNYILDAMDTCGKEFSDALKEAQELGFAEADPSSDIDALDTRHKTTLSANIAFGVALSDEAVSAFGIRHIKKSDLDSAKERGYRIKLIGKAKRVGEAVAAFVEPTLVPMDTPEGNIHGCDNIISFFGSHIGKTHFIGAGAGRYPTGYAVAQDCVDIASGLGGLYNEKFEEVPVANDKEIHSYFVRTTALSDPFFASLEKTPWGEGFEVKCAVLQMHEFAARALASGEEVFFAGIAKF
jgi:homoserine dehydrogenase